VRNPLRIFLGDLTYDTTVTSTNGIPLNIGYLASYIIQKFGSDIEVVLYKYIDKLEQDILKAPPDVLALSNYCWNQNIGHEMFSLLHEENPNALTVWGGPNFHKNRLSQEQWLNKFPEADVYVPLEGEVGFANTIEAILKLENRTGIRSHIRTKTIDNCIIRSLDDNYLHGGPCLRVKDLNGIPSPYLNGLLDKFFDGKLDPYIQTSRGCPFKCSFCVDGSELVSKVNRFNLQRVTEELNYIAKRVPSNIHTLGIMDLNFGMYKGDLEVCDAIVDIQNKYDYPRNISTATGKNARAKIIEAIRKLAGTLRLTIAVQSMDKEVLKNVKRDNISEEGMMDLAPIIKESGLKTRAEVILALPGDTYETHLNTLKVLLNADIDEILVFSCMLLPGSEMFDQREEFGLNTKHRILPNDFGKLVNGKVALETEEVVISTNTMTFDEYVELRLFNFLLNIANMDIAYSAMKKFLKEHQLGLFEVVNEMMRTLGSAPDSVKDVCNSYRRSTIDELWDSSEEIVSNYQQESEYQKLLNGEAGINVSYYHQTLVTVNYMSEWTDFIFGAVKQVLSQKNNFDDVLNSQFQDLFNYSRGLCFNPVGTDRMSTNPKYEFDYDFPQWLDGNEANLPLSRFKLSQKEEIEFRYDQDQYNVIQDMVERFGDDVVSASKSLFEKNVFPSHYFWRKPFMENKTPKKQVS
jgi:radical SAM superfamily enzyme YgiQ (UPF0313 family)